MIAPVVSARQPFLLTVPTQRLITQLTAQAVRSRCVVPLVGPYGAGKTMLLHHWYKVNQPQVQPDQVVVATIGDPARATFGQNLRLMTPSALMVMWELHYALQQLVHPQPYDMRTILQRKPTQRYTENQYLELCGIVRDAINQLQIAVLCVDNAQFLDLKALQELFRLRETCRHQVGMVLCARVPTDGQPGEALRSSVGRLSLQERREVEAELLLPYLQPDTLYADTLPELLIELQADITADVEVDYEAFQSLWWDYSKGQWKALQKIMIYFDQELGPQDNKYRLITADVVHRVRLRLRGW